MAPPGMSLAQITDDFTAINLNYKNDDLWMSINETIIASSDSVIQIETEQNTFKVGEKEILNMNGVIVEIRSETDSNIFVVSWSSDTTRYELSTNGSKIMLDTILQDLKYLK